MHLVKLCQVIKQGDPGYNRLIFFIAIVSVLFYFDFISYSFYHFVSFKTIINESSQWLCLHFKQQDQTNNLLSSTDSSINNKPEDGYSWEFKLFGGFWFLLFILCIIIQPLKIL